MEGMAHRIWRIVAARKSPVFEAWQFGGKTIGDLRVPVFCGRLTFGGVNHAKLVMLHGRT
jgi:hypothetical protein